MHYRQMGITDLPQVAQLYMEYYNTHEDGEWTEHTTTKRIRQVLTREDSYCLVLEDGGNIIAFAMGYFQQYDDGFTYDLVEIVVSAEKQNQGIGSAFMAELEKQVKEKGAILIQLQSVNDEMHEHFYGKLGFFNAKNLVLKSKILQ